MATVPTLTVQQRQLLHEFGKFPLQFSSLIAFGPDRTDVSNEKLSSATVSLIRLRGRQMGITNHHVVEKYRTRRMKGECLFCHLGSVSIDLEQRLISESKELDLAVLDLNGVQDTKIRGAKEIPCQFHEPRSWPPQAPVVGDFVLFGDFQR